MLPLAWASEPLAIDGRVYLALWDDQTSTAGVFDPLSSTVAVAGEEEPNVHVVELRQAGNGVAFVGGQYPSGIYRLSRDEKGRRIADPEPGMTVVDMSHDATNGGDLVWREGNVVPAQRNEYSLWVARLPLRREEARKRKVSSLPRQISSGRMIANAGVALMDYEPDKALLVRLSDGKGWLVPSEPGHSIISPLWVDDDAAWFTTSTGARNRGDGILKISRSTLGEPVERPGF
jgi:hypothetical protein